VPSPAHALATPRIWLLLIGCVSAACQAPPVSPATTPAAVGSNPAISTPTVSLQPSGPPVARFTLVLTAAPGDMRAFVLYLSSATSVRPEELPLCGEAPAPACDVADSPFSRAVPDLPAGSTLVYRIERIAGDGSVHVLLQGSEVVGPGIAEQRATYP
jgi:hypothetical protein